MAGYQRGPGLKEHTFNTIQTNRHDQEAQPNSRSPLQFRSLTDSFQPQRGRRFPFYKRTMTRQHGAEMCELCRV